MTPWFAAGAGIVIAAALAVNTPTALTYGPSGPGGLCTTHSCTGTRRGQPPQVATATPGVAIKDPSADAKGAGPAPAQPGVTALNNELSYHIFWHSERVFAALITMRGAGKTGWSLQFAFSAAQVKNVRGARWHPSRDGAGGRADGPLRGQKRSAPASGSEQSGTPARTDTPNADQMVVIVSGTPQIPSSCTLDGISCHFSTAGGDQASPGAEQPSAGG